MNVVVVSPPAPPSAPPPAPPRLLDPLCQAARQRCYTEPDVAAFADGSRRFLLFPKTGRARAREGEARPPRSV
jgi:hypothetical protein